MRLDQDSVRRDRLFAETCVEQRLGLPNRFRTAGNDRSRNAHTPHRAVVRPARRAARDRPAARESRRSARRRETARGDRLRGPCAISTSQISAGSRPRRTSGKPIFASSAAITMSQAAIKPAPPAKCPALDRRNHDQRAGSQQIQRPRNGRGRSFNERAVGRFAQIESGRKHRAGAAQDHDAVRLDRLPAARSRHKAARASRC